MSQLDSEKITQQKAKHKVWHRKWYLANRERILANSKNQPRSEQYRRRQHEWYLENRERILARDRQRAPQIRATRREKGVLSVAEYKERRKRGEFISYQVLDVRCVQFIKCMVDLGYKQLWLADLLNLQAPSIYRIKHEIQWKWVIPFTKNELEEYISQVCKQDYSFLIRWMMFILKLEIQAINNPKLNSDEKRNKILKFFHSVCASI